MQTAPNVGHDIDIPNTFAIIRIQPFDPDSGVHGYSEERPVIGQWIVGYRVRQLNDMSSLISHWPTRELERWVEGINVERGDINDIAMQGRSGELNMCLIKPTYDRHR